MVVGDITAAEAVTVLHVPKAEAAMARRARKVAEATVHVPRVVVTASNVPKAVATVRVPRAADTVNNARKAVVTAHVPRVGAISSAVRELPDPVATAHPEAAVDVPAALGRLAEAAPVVPVPVDRGHPKSFWLRRSNWRKSKSSIKRPCPYQTRIFTRSSVRRSICRPARFSSAST